MEKGQDTEKGSADRKGPKLSPLLLIVLIAGLFLTLAWFTLIGYAVFALFH